MPALDFPLRHRMIRRTTRMSHVLPLEPFGQVAGDVARPVVREQTRSMHQRSLIQPGSLESQLQRVGDVLGFHRGAELPGDDVAGKVVQHGREIVIAPTDHLELAEIRLPQLVDAASWAAGTCPRP